MEAVALRSLANLPEEFRRYLGDVVVRVQDLATREMLESVGLTHPMQLSGLYTGRPIDNKSVWDVSDGTPDRIYRSAKACSVRSCKSPIPGKITGQSISGYPY